MSTTIRSERSALIRTLLVVLFALVLIAIAWLAWNVRAPIPKIDGTTLVAGLQAPVTIRRDDRGTPHIEAQNEDDAFFAEGFACAQDRLWQMDTTRRRAEGRLSEFAGPDALVLDRYVRTLGLMQAAEADVRSLDPRSRAALDAYSAGINAAAESHPLPIEFSLLQYGWEPWRPVNTMAIVALMAQRLDDQWYYMDVKAALVAKFGPQIADALVDMQMPSLEHHIPGYDRVVAQIPRAALAGRPQLRSGATLPQSLFAFADPTGHGQEHQNQQLDGVGDADVKRKPVLSNDTHLGRTLPSTWWIADLHGGALHVAGFTLPGLPGIVLGHNERIAFGVTSAEEAVEDLYIERFRSSTSDEYMANGVWRKAEHRIERIGVKGQPVDVLDVLVTRHGPIIRRDGTRGLALAWTILSGAGGSQSILALTWPAISSNSAQH